MGKRRIKYGDSGLQFTMYLTAGHGRRMAWGRHSSGVFRRRGSKQEIRVSVELFDAVRAAEITGPEGRDERLSMEQYRKLTMFMSGEMIARITGSLSGAFIGPLHQPKRLQADDPVDELGRRGVLTG
jgi:hypothetical protein